jgi:hypothetical protein
VYVFEKFESLLEASGDEVIAVGRQVADEKLERGVGVKAGLKIARGHGEFVEVGEKAGMLGDESGLHRLDSVPQRRNGHKPL